MTEHDERFDGMPFDEAFVDAAPRHEATAAQRAASAQHARRSRSATPPAETSRGGMRAMLSLIGCLGLVAGIGLLTIEREPSASSAWSGELVTTLPDLEPTYGRRLRPALIAAPTTGAYGFMHTRNDGRPVGYDPCRTVSLVVNPVGGPDDAIALVERAAAELAAASGLEITVIGTTAEQPSLDRPARDDADDRWAPVLVAWADSATIPDLAGDVAGVAGSSWVSVGDGEPYYVSGFVYVDADLGPLPPAALRTTTLTVLRHELGHLVGLDHVDDPRQMMHGSSDGSSALGPGDRAGLAIIGAIPCAPDP